MRPHAPDARAFAAGLRRLHLLAIFLIGFAIAVTACGLVRVALATVVATLVVQTIALEQLRVFAATLGARR